MTERIKKTPVNFTLVSNVVLTDIRLSLKAKGLYAYLYSKPDDWVFHLQVMKAELKESRDAIYSAINELIACGYINRYQQNDGKFGGTVYEFKDPNLPCTENPHTEKPCTENPQTINTDITNTDSKEKEHSNECSKKKSSIDLSFCENSLLKEPFLEWLAFKKEIKKPYKTQRTVEICFRNLQELSGGILEVAEKIVRQSIGNNYQGLFPLKNGVPKRKSEPCDYEELLNANLSKEMKC